jgi:hypothetical protein
MAIPIDAVNSIADAAKNLSLYLESYGPEASPTVISAQINLMKERLERSEATHK